MIIIEEDELAHYGIIRRSGRYPWGSGGIDRNTRNKIFLDYVDELKRQGLSEAKIAEGFGISTTQLRAEKKIAKAQQRQAQIAMAQRLHDKGTSNVAIGKRMGIPESTVRNLLKPGAQDKADLLESTVESLKIEVEAHTYIDVGKGVESQIGVKRSNLDTAVDMMRIQGYELHAVKVTQVATGHQTRMKVLCPPGTTQRDVFLNRDQIRTFNRHSDDGGRTWYGIHYPLSIDKKRIKVNYAEDGGNEADGIIYVRPGVKDISLDGKTYAQVRVLVDGTHYMKGVAVMRDDMPDGVDLVFNTTKPNTGNKLDAMKPITEDSDNPFGSVIKSQIVANKDQPDERVTSAMNIVYEEGDWDDWSRSLSTQMLSKQSRPLIKTQLDMTYEQRQNEYDEIMSLTNSTVRKRLLKEFAESTDASAVHLKAASLPRQSVRVILPMSSLKPNQIYAPGYNNGDEVVLIRHPHGGTFEIPQLTVNNRHQASKKLLGDSVDAVAIHHSVAKVLSGADFDGDTVVVIPNPKGAREIKISPPLEGLKDFDPHVQYKGHPDMKVMSNTQTEMGKISNLITDMTIQGAPHSDLVRAIRHSMVVIDAEKHGLDHRMSYNDNGIKDLKKKYQPDGGGAATIISRARARKDVPQREERSMKRGGPIDPVTGEKRYQETRRTHWKTGKPLTTKTTKLAEAKDAIELVSESQYPVELMYATHSNKLKAMANQARVDQINTPPSKWVPSAKKTFSKEVESLDYKLQVAERNAPLERQAQLLANKIIKMKRDEHPNMDEDMLKKIKFQALEEARSRTGARKNRIEISQEEWDAIQAGAISDSKMNSILNNANMDTVRELATPRSGKMMTTQKMKRAKDMMALGYTRAEVAQQLAVSVSTLDKAMTGAA